MPKKVFTTLGGTCPHRGCEFDSPDCRKCEWFYRTGMATFFWCNHPEAKQPDQQPEKRKRGRPPGSKKTTKPDIPKIGRKKAVKTRKPKNK